MARHAFWAAGFRPLFAAGLLAGLLLPALWSAALLGLLPLPAKLAVAPVVWHAHEMLFGFGAAVLGGFLLTASKNWVSIRGYHGWPLACLLLAWLLQRMLIAVGTGLPPVLLVLTGSLYTGGLVTMLIATLWRHRRQDSYGADNRYFLIALPLLVPAQWALLSAGGYAAGIAVTVAVFRLALLIMLERTLTQFMRAAFGIDLWRHPAVDHAIKGFALLLAAGPWLPPTLHGAALLCLATLTGFRWLRWQPWKALTRLDIGVMYLAQLAIIAGLLLQAVALAPQAGGDSGASLAASGALHAFTVGVMGLIIAAMIIRISRGHTGRKVAFDALDKAVLWLLLAAALLRVAGPALLPAGHAWWIGLSAAAWTLAFLPLALRFIPLYLKPRVDGRAG